jgi:hypothetical protein
MDLRKWLLGAAGAVAFGTLAGPVQAAPAIGPAAGAIASESSAVETVHWRWRRHHYYRPYYFAPSYYYYRPYRHYYGGYGYWPGYRHYRHHHWRHHRHWW